MGQRNGDGTSVGAIRGGLLSVTFRKLSARRVVELATEAKLDGIEWGADVHVPPGDAGIARSVKRMCDDAGIAVACYGSYHHAGGGDSAGDFERILDSAGELGAPLIRVWAGRRGSADADGAYRGAVASDLADLCDRAAARGIEVAMEYHDGTLTDTLESTLGLIDAVGGGRLKTLWQPRHGAAKASGVADLGRLMPWLRNLHVFHWWPDATHRLPLAEGAGRWPAFLDAARADGRDRWALLEFVSGDDEGQFLRDAATLRGWLETV